MSQSTDEMDVPAFELNWTFYLFHTLSWFLFNEYKITLWIIQLYLHSFNCGSVL